MVNQATSLQVKLGPFLRSRVINDSSDKCSLTQGFLTPPFSKATSKLTQKRQVSSEVTTCRQAQTKQL